MTAASRLADARLLHLPRTATKAGRSRIVVELLTDFAFVMGKAERIGVRELAEDYRRALASDLDLASVERKALTELHTLLRAAAVVVRSDWTQLPGQLLARIDPATAVPSLERLTRQARAWRGKSWLEPLLPSLRYHHRAEQPVPPADPVIGLVAVGVDARRHAALSANGLVRVWDVESGDLVQTLACGNPPAVCIAAAPEGDLIAVGSAAGTVTVWDLDGGVRVAEFRAHRWEVGALAFLSGEGLVTGSADGALMLWRPPFGRHAEPLPGHTGWVGGLATGPSDGSLASCSDDGTVRLQRLDRTGAVSEGYGPWACSVAVSPDGSAVAAGYENGAVTLWHPATGRSSAVLWVGPARVDAVMFAGSGDLVVSGNGDGVLRVWRDTGQLIAEYLGHTAPVSALAPAPGGGAVSAGEDGRILRWDLTEPAGTSPGPGGGHTGCVGGLAAHPDGRHAVSAGHDGRVLVWDVGLGRSTALLAVHGRKSTAVAVTPAGDLVVSAGTDGFLRLWEWPSGRPAGVLSGHDNAVLCVAVTPDGRFVVSGSEDCSIRIWDLSSGREIRRLTGHQAGVRGVAVMPDGGRILSTSVDGTFRVWTAATGEQRAVLEFGDWLNGIAPTTDSRYALCASDREEQALLLLDTDSGRMETFWPGRGWAYAVTVSPDGRRVASTSGAGAVHVWRLAPDGVATDSTLAHLCAFTVEEPLYCCALTPDGHIVLAGDQAGRVHFLRVHESLR